MERGGATSAGDRGGATRNRQREGATLEERGGTRHTPLAHIQHMNTSAHRSVQKAATRDDRLVGNESARRKFKKLQIKPRDH